LCTVCLHPETHVIETRQDDDESVRRRRECLKCGMRFTTRETLKLPRKKKVMSHDENKSAL